MGLFQPEKWPTHPARRLPLASDKGRGQKQRRRVLGDDDGVAHSGLQNRGGREHSAFGEDLRLPLPIRRKQRRTYEDEDGGGVERGGGGFQH